MTAPESTPDSTPAPSGDTTYPLTTKVNVNFSVYEDRLVLRANRGEHGPVALLLTRRMVLVVLQHLVGQLPRLEGLDQTPAQYWQDVLQMAHQRAMEARQPASSDEKPEPDAPADASAANDKPANPPELFLATELTLKRDGRELLVAFKGLPMPQAMTNPSPHVPVVAIGLQAENVHQLVQLLITKAHEARWHLPLDLPWLESPGESKGSASSVTLH